MEALVKDWRAGLIFVRICNAKVELDGQERLKLACDDLKPICNDQVSSNSQNNLR